MAEKGERDDVMKIIMDALLVISGLY